MEILVGFLMSRQSLHHYFLTAESLASGFQVAHEFFAVHAGNTKLLHCASLFVEVACANSAQDIHKRLVNGVREAELIKKFHWESGRTAHLL